MWIEIRFILKDGTNRTFCRIKYGKRVTFHVCVMLTLNKFCKLIYNGELNVTILWMIQDEMTHAQRLLNQLSKRMSWHKWNKLLDHWCYHHIEQDLHWHLMLNHLDQRLAYSQKTAWDASFDLTKGSFILYDIPHCLLVSCHNCNRFDRTLSSTRLGKLKIR